MSHRRAGPVLSLALLCCTAAPPPRPTPAPPEPFDLDRHLGLVFVRGGDRAVLYTTRRVAPGTRVLVVLPEKQRVIHGRVTDERPPEEEYVQRPFGSTVTALRASLRLRTREDEMPALGIAVVGRAVRIHRGPGYLQAELNGTSPPEAFRACASAEGAHLTLWSGEPLSGQRRWHVYYYLGYDTEMDCTPGDV